MSETVSKKMYDEFFDEIEDLRKKLQEFTQRFLANDFTTGFKTSFDGDQDFTNNCYIQLASILGRMTTLSRDVKTSTKVFEAMERFACRSEDTEYVD